MLKEDLLLDSAREFSEQQQCGKDSGRKDNQNPCVPFSCHDSLMKCWYALRVSYSRELKIQSKLNAEGVRTFVPMEWKKKEENGKQTKYLAPAVNNLCFAQASKSELEGFISGFGEDSPVHFYWDRTTRRPVIVPDKAMEDFITVASAIDHDILYIRDITPKLREGASVTVLEGPFKGVRGKIVRIKKSRRVLVELPGFLAVTTNYVNPQSLRLEISEP